MHSVYSKSVTFFQEKVISFTHSEQSVKKSHTLEAAFA